MKYLKHLQLWSRVVAVGSLALLAACGGVSDSSKVTEPADVTNGNLTDSRDGKTYKTVTIGSQTWMAENLNYADSANTPSLKGKSWCYNDSVANCEAAGRLYTWAAAIDSVKLANDASNPLDCGFGKTCGLSGKVQGICPSGWHLPSPAEWKTLFAAVGGQDNAGKVLKSQSGWDENGNGTDAYGFSARKGMAISTMVANTRTFGVLRSSLAAMPTTCTCATTTETGICTTSARTMPSRFVA